MIDPDGVEWLPAREAATRLGVPAGTIRSWRARGKVAGHQIAGRWWVSWPDVLDAERDTRGAYLALRRDQLHTRGSSIPLP